MEGKHENCSAVAVEASRWGSDEMNLAEFPIGVLTDQQPRGVMTVEREDTAWCPKRRVHFPRKVTVTATDKWGLPCAGDNDVLLAIVSLTKKANNFGTRDLEFSRAQIARELGWNQNGRTYRRIKIALHRLAGVRVIWERSFFENAEKRLATKDTGVLDGFELYERYVDGSLFDTEGRPSKLYWSEELFRSFGANYVKPINMEVYRRLELPVARQTFRLLDKRFHYEGRCRFKLREFSQKIGLTDYRYESKIKQKLTPSLKALEDNGVIRAGRHFETTGRHGEHWVSFIQGDYERKRGRSMVAVPAASPANVTDKSAGSSLANELRSRGVKSGRAKKLAAVASGDVVRRAIAQWDFLCSVGKHPKGAGWLATNIESGGYADPPGFTETRPQARVTRPRRATVAPAKQMLDAQEEEADAAELDELAAFLDSLSPDERADFESKAISAAHPLSRDVASRESSGADEIRKTLLLRELARSRVDGVEEPA